MPKPPLQAQINDLLRFVFSPPATPGKAAIKVALGKDWRSVIKEHCDLSAAQAEEIGNFTPKEVAQLKGYMVQMVKAGKAPRVRVVPTKAPTSGGDKKAKVAAKEKESGDTNYNIYC